MDEYRHKITGEVKSQGEWRAANPNISMPRVWNQNVLDALNIEAVLEAPKPDACSYQYVARNGVVQDTKGNWVTAWEVLEMFSDDEDSTKAEKEAAYQAGLDATAAKYVRDERDRKLAETDWMALSDVTMSAEMATYRQALRDITTQEGFPRSVDWPAKP
jgi:Phage tail assembly chaperone protein